MSQSPIILGLHFVLELAALAAAAYWGWTMHAGPARWVWGIGLPLVLAAGWALFRAADDGPDPMVTIPGFARLVLELVILAGAAVLLWRAGQPILAAVFGASIVVDFSFQYDRVGRLLGAWPK